MFKRLLNLLICFALLIGYANASTGIIVNDAIGRTMIGKQIWVLLSNRELDFKAVLKSADFKKMIRMFLILVFRQ